MGCDGGDGVAGDGGGDDERGSAFDDSLIADDGDQESYH
jgi:hypothetical protein